MILKKFFEKFTPSSLSSSSSRAAQQSSSQSSLRANRSQSLNAVESSSSSPTLLSASSHRISVSASSSSRGARQTSSASGSASGLAVSEGHLASANSTTMAASNYKTAVSPTAAAVSPNAVQFRNEDENDRNYTTSRHDTSGEIDDLHLHHDHNTKLLYKNANHTYKILNQLNQMRKENQMCDVVLIIEDEEIYCHKAILVTNSPYFLAMFSSGLMETSLSRVELKDIDVDSSKELIDYMYTGELPITESNVQMLLITANLFGMINIKDSCAQFIQSQLDVNNCLGIREFADIHSCNVLVKHSEAFIDQYFSEIVQKDEFLSLEVDQVIRVVSREHLSVSSEKIVYDALLRWLTHNYEKRAPYLARVMQCVRFGLMRHDELLIISQTPMIKKNLVCMEYVSEAIHYRLVKSVENEFEKCADQFNRIRISPRVPLGLPKMMYVFGGQAPKAISTIEVYDFRSQKWAYHNDMPTKRCRAGCVFHDGRIYLIGGFNGQSRVRTVDIYSPQTREWSSGPEMISRRGTLGVGLLNDTIYAVGGFDGSTGLNSVECWNLNSEIPAWTSVAPLNVRRSSVGIAVLKQFMYVVGGYCGLTRECLSSVERYDPASSKWSMVTNMNVRRSGACVNVYEGHIYVVGGHDGPQVLKSVETYDPISNKWTLIAELNVARRNAGFVIHNGLFYVIGGDDGHENLSSVEIYNPQRGLWSLLPEFLNTAKSYMSILVIEDYSSYN